LLESQDANPDSGETAFLLLQQYSSAPAFLPDTIHFVRSSIVASKQINIIDVAKPI
jgi:hypothetical protein